MNLQRLTHPENPESYATHLKENYIIGGVPAIVTSIKDPRSLGRIQCRCDLIDPYNNLPNGSDGWIPTTEAFTVPEGSGGTHKPLKEGCLVLLIPILGKPNNWICIDCIPNSTDRPSSELNRSKGLYGYTTEAGISQVNNEVDNSQITAFPQGVSQIVTGDGDTIAQTLNGKHSIRKDGTILSESPKASLSLLPDGNIIQQNSAGAIASLKEDGTIKIKNAFDAELRLDDAEVSLTGSLSSLGRNLVDTRKAFTGHLFQGTKVLEQIQNIIRNPSNLKNLDSTLGEVLAMLQKLQGGIGKTYNQGMNALKELTKTPLKTFSEAISPAMNFVFENNLGTIIGKIQSAMLQVASPKSFIQQILGFLPNEWREKIQETGSLEKLVSGLQHNPSMLLQAILQQIVPGGIESALFNLGIYQILDRLQIISSRRLAPELELNTNQMANFIAAQQKDVFDLLPATLQELVDTQQLSNIINNPKEGLKAIASRAQQALINQGQALLNQAGPSIGLIDPVTGLIESWNKGDFEGAKALLQTLGLPDGKIEDLLPKVLQPLVDQLQPLLKQGAQKIQEILGGISNKIRGATLKLENYSATLQASSLLPGGKVQVDATGGFLQAANGINRIYADMGGAGIATPWGRFSLGGNGGGFFTQGLMALRVVQDIGKSAGMLLHPQKGVSLSSFSNGYIPREDEEIPWANQTAEVTVDEGTVKILSHGSTHAGIVVAPEGTYINGLLVYDYVYALSDRITTAYTNISTLSDRANTVDSNISSINSEINSIKQNVQNIPVQSFPTTTTLWADQASSLFGGFIIQDISTQRYGYLGSFSVPNVGSEIRFSFFIAAGTYTLSFLGAATSDSGIATILLNGNSVGIIDFYSGATINNTRRNIAITIPQSGNYGLNLKMNTKNTNATSHNLYLTKVWMS